MPSSSSNREHRLQHWRAEAPASRQVQGFDLVTPWHFCFHFSHSFQRNQKISDFVGNTAFWFAWGQCFTLKLFFFLLYIYTHIYINLHTWYKRLILRKKKMLPTAWTCHLSEEFCFLKKSSEFPLVWLNSITGCVSRQTEKSGLPTASPLFSTFNSLLL